jgi:Low-density lipoprotein receptor domain class A
MLSREIEDMIIDNYIPLSIRQYLIFSQLSLSDWIIYYIWWSSPVSGSCPNGSFACDNDTVCVPQRQVCDGHPHCKDNQDEDPIECGMQILA